jgi:tRNA A-37 threonylcarbamoyl transferase component Bud32
VNPHTEIGEERSRQNAPRLGPIGVQRELSFAGIHLSGRRRRPSGERPPLPRDFRSGGTFWLLLAALVGVMWLTLLTLPGATDFWGRLDNGILLRIDRWRNDAATAMFEAASLLMSDLAMRIVRIGLILALVFYKRWRHLVAAIVAIAVVQFIAAQMTTIVARPRPLIEPLIPWEGYAHPSVPIASLAVTIGVIGYAMFPLGSLRRYWFLASGCVFGVAVFARMYLGVDHPTDALVAIALATALTVLVYELFVPRQAFPVSYRRTNTAHLDVGGSRGAAIVSAMRDQLGVDVIDIRPIGLAGSAGSTPLLLTCTGVGSEDEQHLFAKLYAASHLRADRWYKWGRLILYGSLEDEVRFTSVRRLVEHEDYLMRVMKDAGVPGAEAFGFVEITPEREYLMVTEFLDGAREIGEVEVDPIVIDAAIAVVRDLWDAGLAHRDIKPSNIMVRGDTVMLIDVSFAQVRPSPWRQAVDLANMMLVLALRSDPRLVYERALQRFSPVDVAEAFAATQSVTISSQTRKQLRQHRMETGRDLVDEFRALAPRRDRISIQRWSARRIAVTVITLAAGMALLSIIVDNLQGQGVL